MIMSGNYDSILALNIEDKLKMIIAQIRFEFYCCAHTLKYYSAIIKLLNI